MRSSVKCSTACSAWSFGWSLCCRLASWRSPFIPLPIEPHDLMNMPDGTTAPSIGVWSQLVVRYADKLPGLRGPLDRGGAGRLHVHGRYAPSVGASSFVVNDLYRRHLRPDASEQEHIRVARIVMVAMMVLSTFLALGINDIGPWVFFINAAMIAPALPLSWLRWFWWRLNVWGEVFGILVSVPSRP